jgi:hypothetical protein
MVIPSISEKTNERLHNSLVSWADLKTDGAKAWMKNNLACCDKQSNKNPKLESRKIKNFMKICNDSDVKGLVGRFTELYDDLMTITDKKTTLTTTAATTAVTAEPKNLETEATGELIFLGEIFQPLNFVPYLLSLWSLMRIWIMPISTFIMPILILILPYFYITCIIGKSLSVDQYLIILKSLALSTLPSPPGLNFGGSVTTRGGSSGSLMTLVSLGFTVFQSVFQSYWSHKHLYSINNLLLEKAEKICEFLELYEKVYDILKSKAGIEIFRLNWPVDKQDVRQTLAVTLLYPNILRIYIQCIVEVEVWCSLARKVMTGEATIVRWIGGCEEGGNGPNIEFKLVNAYDPDVINTKRVPVNINLNSADTQHYLLTGPNRGGKSTALRAIAASLYLSHTFGIALGTHCKSSIFSQFYISLTPDDLPGKKSRFEREIELCSKILLPDNKPKIVLIDELFHSTNPPDAEFSSKVFTERLWKSPKILSIISTHLFNFVENAPSNIGRLCCPAERVITDEGKSRLIFSYGLTNGICRISSVESLLRSVRLLE